MPTLHEIKCTHCGFQISEWNILYGIDPAGSIVDCGYGYFNDPEKVTGLPICEAGRQNRLGNLRQCVCRGCFERFMRYVPHESKACPRYAGTDVAELRDLILFSIQHRPLVEFGGA